MSKSLTHEPGAEPPAVRWAKVSLVAPDGTLLASGATAAPLTPGSAAIIPLRDPTDGGPLIPYLVGPILIRFEETTAP